MKQPRISIIILNWNGWEDTIECLESLYKINYLNYEVIVVDNGSTDQSVKMIKDWSKGRRLSIIENDKNYGFAGGNNIAMEKILKKAESDYILLLNNDAVVDKKFLIELVKVSEEYKNVGIVGPKIYDYGSKDKKNIVQSAGGKINFYIGRFSHRGQKQIEKKQFERIEKVDYVCGACLLIKIRVIKQIGLLESKFFAYFEDVDWCIRARENDFRAVYAPGSLIWHKQGKALEDARGSSLYYNTRNLFWVERKYASRVQLILFLYYYLVIQFPKKLAYCFFSKNRFEMYGEYLRSLKDGLSVTGY